MGQVVSTENFLRVEIESIEFRMSSCCKHPVHGVLIRRDQIGKGFDREVIAAQPSNFKALRYQLDLA
jgi:hypothetical protein